MPSDVLQAASQADKTLQQTALFAGLLALAVGGLGIANVMSISVIQRSSEIGIRRAVGHSRSKIGSQFLLESLFVGILGGILGAALGIGVVYLVSSFADWVVVIAYARSRSGWLSRSLVSVARRSVPVDQGRPPRTARDAAPRITARGRRIARRLGAAVAKRRGEYRPRGVTREIRRRRRTILGAFGLALTALVRAARDVVGRFRARYDAAERSRSARCPTGC